MQLFTLYKTGYLYSLFQQTIFYVRHNDFNTYETKILNFLKLLEHNNDNKLCTPIKIYVILSSKAF